MNGSDLMYSAPPPHHPRPLPPPAEADESGTLLAPGFRFHPTDDELVTYYLKRKIQNKPLRVDAIGEIDLYKCEPWDLPSKSRIRSRDLEWYFFSPLDRKQSSNRLRTNRGTEQGYWKTTGKDREVRHGGRVAGMKKTLVYHTGRAPRGKRTNWVMHEYRLEGDGITEESYVVCRIFQKNGPGPQNGAQYGAPFVEDEWDELTADNNDNNNGLLMFGLSDHNDDDSNDAAEREFLQMNDLLQNQEVSNANKTPVPTPAPVPDMSQLERILQEPIFTGEENSSPTKTDEYLELNDLATDLALPNNQEETLNFDEFFDPKESFMQMNEIIYSPLTSQNSGLDFVDDFLTYYDAPDDNLFYNDISYNKVIDENSVIASNATQTGSSSSNKLQEANNNNNIFSHENDDSILSDKKPLGKFASFLDSFNAPPAFAEEFPATSAKSKSGVLSPAHVDPVHAASNMIRIDSMTLTDSTGNADMELLLSYKSLGFDTNPKYHCGISSVLRGGFCLFSLSAFMLLLSYKIGLCVCEH